MNQPRNKLDGQREERLEALLGMAAKFEPEGELPIDFARQALAEERVPRERSRRPAGRRAGALTLALAGLAVLVLTAVRLGMEREPAPTSVVRPAAMPAPMPRFPVADVAPLSLAAVSTSIVPIASKTAPQPRRRQARRVKAAPKPLVDPVPEVEWEVETVRSYETGLLQAAWLVVLDENGEPTRVQPAILNVPLRSEQYVETPSPEVRAAPSVVLTGTSEEVE